MTIKPYTVFKRKKIYYVQFRLPDGKRSIPKSTGQTSKSKSEAWCIDYLKAGGIVQKENVTLSEFSEDFYNFNGSWVTDKKISGKRISQRQCNEKTAILNNRILPELGFYKLTQISKTIIKEFRNNLFNQGLSGSSINNTLSTLKPILEMAEEKSLIQAVPKIERASNRPKKNKGILTVQEVRQLFNEQWDDYRLYAINLTASITGLRRGELLALQIKDINGNYINVSKSWDYNLQILNETTKTGRSRTVIIPGFVKEKLNTLISSNPFGLPGSFIFYSNSHDKPIDAKVVSKSFNMQLYRIGINEDLRIEKGLSFHSHRHFFNSLLINAKVPLAKVQSLTGHVSANMSNSTYYHIDDMQDVIDIQEKVLM